jgi:recombination endonuclease VII
MAIDIEEKRRRDRERQAKRYAEDPKFRERKKAATKAWVSAKKLKERWEHRLKTRYGLTAADYNEMLARQEHVCLLCGRRSRRRLAVDHCHRTGLVRALLCTGCNSGLGHLGDDPVVARRAGEFLEAWYAFVSQLYNTEENDMTSNDETTDDGKDDNKAARLMRQEILNELQRPFGSDPPPPENWLQAVSRFLVTRAAQDLSAAKEVLDRIDGKTPSAPTNDQPQRLLNVSWKFPPSKLNPPKQNSSNQNSRQQDSSKDAPKPTSKPATKPAMTTPTSTRRASSSSRSTNGKSASPAS